MTYQHIRDLREDADLTQGQIAGMIPCSQQAYSLYERGDRDIPTGVLIRLAEIHRTTTDYPPGPHRLPGDPRLHGAKVK